MRWAAIGVLATGIAVVATSGFCSPINAHRPHAKDHARPAVTRAPRSGWTASPAGGWVFYGPGYTFVPGKGILGAPCNLPTSACPNSMREVN